MAKYNVSKKEAKEQGIKRVKIKSSKKSKKSSSKTSSKTSKRNLKKLKEMGASEKTIKSYGKRVSDSEMSRYYENNNPLVQSVLEQTPSFRTPPKTFEETYTPELQQEDLTQSKALFEPYFQQQISDVMEDLNAWAANEHVDYTRTLRRARASYASRNAGIGSQRQRAEEETTSDYQRRGKEMTKQTERNVGTEAIKEGGFTPFYEGREGEIAGNMKTAIKDQQQKFKNEAIGKYEDATSKYYKQEGTSNWLGQPI